MTCKVTKLWQAHLNMMSPSYIPLIVTPLFGGGEGYAFVHGEKVPLNELFEYWRERDSSPRKSGS